MNTPRAVLQGGYKHSTEVEVLTFSLSDGSALAVVDALETQKACQIADAEEPVTKRISTGGTTIDLSVTIHGYRTRIEVPLYDTTTRPLNRAAFANSLASEISKLLVKGKCSPQKRRSPHLTADDLYLCGIYYDALSGDRFLCMAPRA